MILSRRNLFFLQRYAALLSLASLICSVLCSFPSVLLIVCTCRLSWAVARAAHFIAAAGADGEKPRFPRPRSIFLLPFLSPSLFSSSSSLFHFILFDSTAARSSGASPHCPPRILCSNKQTKQNKNQANMRSPRQLATMVSKRRSSSPLSTTSLRGTAAAFPPDLSCLATSPAGPRLWALPSSASPRSPRNPKSLRSPRSPSRRSWRRASRPPSGGSPRLPRT